MCNRDPIDCDYRRAVVKHQEMVRKARSQMDKLPVRRFEFDCNC